MGSIREMSAIFAGYPVSAPPWTIGLGLSLIVVCVPAILWLAFRSRGFGHEAEVVKALALPVVASIPLIETPHERAARRRRRIAMALSALLVVAASVGLVWWRSRL